MDFSGKETIEAIGSVAIIQGKNIVERTVEFSRKRKDWSYGWIGYNQRPKKLLKQPLYFPVEEKIETMNRLAIIQGQNIVDTTVGFFSKRIDWNYGQICYNPKGNNSWNNGWIFQEKKRLKL